MLHSQGFMAHFQVVNNKQFSWRSDHLLKSCGSLLTDSLSSVFILEKNPGKRGVHNHRCPLGHARKSV